MPLCLGHRLVSLRLAAPRHPPDRADSSCPVVLHRCVLRAAHRVVPARCPVVPSGGVVRGNGAGPCAGSRACNTLGWALAHCRRNDPRRRACPQRIHRERRRDQQRKPFTALGPSRKQHRSHHRYLRSTTVCRGQRAPDSSMARASQPAKFRSTLRLRRSDSRRGAPASPRAVPRSRRLEPHRLFARPGDHLQRFRQPRPNRTSRPCAGALSFVPHCGVAARRKRSPAGPACGHATIACSASSEPRRRHHAGRDDHWRSHVPLPLSACRLRTHRLLSHAGRLGLSPRDCRRMFLVDRAPLASSKPPGHAHHHRLVLRLRRCSPGLPRPYNVRFGWSLSICWDGSCIASAAP